MCASFSDDDVGKTVVNANGDEVGMVTAVEHDTIRVKPDAGITDSIKAALGWEDTGEDTYPLQEASIDRVTADEIRLAGDLREGGSSTAGGGTSSGGSETGIDDGVGTDRGDESGTLDRDRDEPGTTESVHDEPRAEEGLSGDSDDVRSADSRDVGTEIGSGSGTGRRAVEGAGDRAAERSDRSGELGDRERDTDVSETAEPGREDMVGGGEPPGGERTGRTGRTPDEGLDDVGEERLDSGEGRDRAGASERRGGGGTAGDRGSIDADADADSDRGEGRRVTDSDRGDADSDADSDRLDGDSDSDRFGADSDDEDEWPTTDSDTDR
ncbi:hypothetical protein [Halovivax limisalsi]|uniref:hypothetical protein n=1 Tax=Halovivax limisalsi TaxID=1453760 RepID=UPI001FFDD8E4|nr:hypothetical protein [Halovivax limisalsi]